MTVPESVNLKALEEIGAHKMIVEPSNRVVWLVAGPPKTGKSRLFFDSPGPLGYINIDKGEEGTVEEFIPVGIWEVAIRMTREMISNPNTELVKTACEPLMMKALKAFD